MQSPLSHLHQLLLHSLHSHVTLHISTISFQLMHSPFLLHFFHHTASSLSTRTSLSPFPYSLITTFATLLYQSHFAFLSSYSHIFLLLNALTSPFTPLSSYSFIPILNASHPCTLIFSHTSFLCIGTLSISPPLYYYYVLTCILTDISTCLIYFTRLNLHPLCSSSALTHYFTGSYLTCLMYLHSLFSSSALTSYRLVSHSLNALILPLLIECSYSLFYMLSHYFTGSYFTRLMHSHLLCLSQDLSFPSIDCIAVLSSPLFSSLYTYTPSLTFTGSLSSFYHILSLFIFIGSFIPPLQAIFHFFLTIISLYTRVDHSSPLLSSPCTRSSSHIYRLSHCVLASHLSCTHLICNCTVHSLSSLLDNLRQCF